jgi:hypothetical protein
MRRRFQPFSVQENFVMRISALVAGATLAFGLAACSDSSSNDVTAPSSPVTYTVKSIDGQPLPWTYSVSGLTLISWALTVNPDGTWSDATAYLDGTQDTDSGTYTISGNTETFINNGKMYTATISGDQLTGLSFAGHTATFQTF